MKPIGFLKEHDLGLSGLKSVKQLVNPEISYDAIIFDKLLNYLETGVTVWGLLVWLHDEDGTSIGPCGLQTDGKWIWPSYFAYYLKKHPNIEIPVDFLEDVAENDFNVPNLSKKMLLEAEKYLVDFFKIKIPKSSKKNKS